MTDSNRQENEMVIRQLYTAFQARDYSTMQSLYHDDATFTDPVFRNLNAAEVKAMWQMLITAGKDLRIAFANIEATNLNGSCSWEAWYTFSRTGKSVHNIVRSKFEFKDGRIISQVDTFDFWRWSRMAFGVSGVVLGWSPFLRNKVAATAREGLSRFMEKSRS